jgi:hypothetical protein
MSTYASTNISRSTARAVIIQSILSGRIDDTGLGLILDEIFQNETLRSFDIVPDGTENQDYTLIQRM